MTGTHLLHLDSSARGAASFSRQLGRELILAWSRREPGAVVTYRDLNAEPLPFVSDTWVSAAYSPVEMHDHTLTFALSRSEALIRELEAADVLVIGAPMYNFGIPASLKAWIDQVVRLGRTFVYDGPKPVGVVHGKRAMVLAPSGGAVRYEDVGLDFRKSYLRAILSFIGITDIDFIMLNGTMVGDVDLAPARADMEELLDRYFADQLISPGV